MNRFSSLHGENPLEVRSHFDVTSTPKARNTTDVGVRWFLVIFSFQDGPTRRGDMQGAYFVAGAEDRSLIAALVLSQDGFIFARRYLRK